MKKFMFGFAALFAVMVFCVSTVSATTYLHLSVNGNSSATTMEQGDLLGWELDCGVGDTVFCEDYLDLNNNHVIDAGDELILEWQMADGMTGTDGPGDSSATPDGEIVFSGMPISFQTGNYCIKATDKDQSSAFDYLEITALSTPLSSVSGTVHIEGVTAPDQQLRYIMVAGFSQTGMWSDLTDNKGDYKIEFNTISATWDLGLNMEKDGYDRRGDTTILVTGNVTGIDFWYMLGIEENSTTNKLASINIAPAPVFRNATIEYALGKTASVELGLYNSSGILVKNLESGLKNAGSHSINMATNELSSGVYFVKLRADGYTVNKKMVVMK